MSWTRTVPAPPAPSGPGRRTRVLAAAVASIAVLGTAVALRGGPARIPPPLAAPTQACAPAWVTAWQTAAQPASASTGLAGSTLRMIVHPQVTGSEVRVRLSNAYGATPLVVGSVSAGRSNGNAATAALVPGTAQPVGFGGVTGVTIPPGGQALSDPVPTVAEVGVPLAVSLFVVAAPSVVTEHAVALQTSYVSHVGDVALASGGGAFDATTASWLVLTGVDVLAPRPENAVVTVGDSITDGVGSGADADDRWSDALATRLTSAGGAADMAVLNAGISRNELLAGSAEDGDSPLGHGSTAMSRVPREPPTSSCTSVPTTSPPVGVSMRSWPGWSSSRTGRVPPASASSSPRSRPRRTGRTARAPRPRSGAR